MFEKPINALAWLLALFFLVILGGLAYYLTTRVKELEAEVMVLKADRRRHLTKQTAHLKHRKLGDDTEKAMAGHSIKDGGSDIDWLESFTHLTDRLNNQSLILFTASKNIIDAHLTIKNNLATTATHVFKGDNMASYQETAIGLEEIFLDLKRTCSTDHHYHHQLLHMLTQLASLIDREYTSQLESDLKAHQACVTDFSTLMTTFLATASEIRELEWSKIKAHSHSG